MILTPCEGEQKPRGNWRENPWDDAAFRRSIACREHTVARRNPPMGNSFITGFYERRVWRAYQRVPPRPVSPAVPSSSSSPTSWTLAFAHRAFSAWARNAARVVAAMASGFVGDALVGVSGEAGGGVESARFFTPLWPILPLICVSRP